MRRWLLHGVWGGVVLLLAVLVVSAQNRPELYNLPASTVALDTSGSLAMTRSGRLVVANGLANTVSIIQTRTNSLDAEINVSHQPHSVALTTDSTRALVTTQAIGQLVVIELESAAVIAAYDLGATPAGVVSNSNDTAFVALQGRDEVIQIDINTGAIINRITTPPHPEGLALWGDYLYVTHVWSGELSLIYLPLGSVVRTIQTGAGGQNSHSYTLAIDPVNDKAYLPQTRLNDALPITTTDNRLLPIITVVDLRSMRVLHDERIDLVWVDRMAQMPYAVTLNPFYTQLYVTYAGSNSATRIDLRTGQADAHFATGAAPQDITFSRDNLSLYVHDAIDHTLTQVDVRFHALQDTVPTTLQTLDVATFIGARLWHSAADTRLSVNHAGSCVACHVPLGDTGLLWAMPDDALPTENTPDAAFINQHIQQWQGGRGLDADSLEMQFLIDYLQTQLPPYAR